MILSVRSVRPTIGLCVAIDVSIGLIVESGLCGIPEQPACITRPPPLIQTQQLNSSFQHQCEKKETIVIIYTVLIIFVYMPVFLTRQ